MRNSPLSTVTTNSRGVSSLSRITLCRRGRSGLRRTLVRGLIAVSDIAAAARGHAAAIFACSPPCVQFAQGLNGERTTETRRRRASSSLVFALDALAGVVLHERGSDET